jgi:sporulation integral membrane protein YtvI
MTQLRAFYANHQPLIHKIGILTLCGAAIFISARLLLAYVAPFVLGFLISVMLEPAVRFFHKKCKIPRAIASITLILITILLLIFGIGTGISKLAQQADTFINNLPRHSENIRNAMTSLSDRFLGIIEILPHSWRDAIEEADIDLVGNLAQILGRGIGTGGANAVKQLPGIILFVIFTIISAFFFTKDKQKMTDFISTHFKKDGFVRRTFTELKNGIGDTLAGYVRTQLIIWGMTGGMVTLGLIILREPYALLLGITIGFIDALPLFGAGWVLMPWAVYHFITGRYAFGVGLVIIYGTVFLVKQLLTPKILGSQIGIHPLIVLISLYAGLRMFGAPGIIIGPVVAVCLKVIIKSDMVSVENP